MNSEDATKVLILLHKLSDLFNHFQDSDDFGGRLYDQLGDEFRDCWNDIDAAITWMLGKSKGGDA